MDPVTTQHPAPAPRWTLGILEPRGRNTPATIPGTEDIFSSSASTTSSSTTDSSRNPKIILHPPPTASPNDPLNWPRWYRDSILFLLTTVAVLATVPTPLLAADSIYIANLFYITFQRAANLTAFNLVGVTVGTILSVPSARVWGKRHVFLLGALLITASSIWAGYCHVNPRHKYTQFLWARILQGVGTGPFESLINSVVGDLYYVHERGPRMAFVNTAIFGGAFVTPVFAGMIFKRIDWWWGFWMLGIFMAVGFLLLLLVVPETTFEREGLQKENGTGNGTGRRENETILAPIGATPESSIVVDAYGEKNLVLRTEVLVNGRRTGQVENRRMAKKTYLQQIAPFDGRKTDDNYFKLLLRPFPLYFHPAVFWGCLMQGVIIGWTVMVGVIMAFIFLGPPLLFDGERTGKQYTAAFIGAMLGLVLSGLYTEFVTRAMIKANRGRYEPEFRILLVIPTFVFTAIGLYGFGITASNTYKYGWLIPDVFLAFIIISMAMGAIASAQYLLDAYKDLDVEIFTALIIFKNMFSFVLAYKAFDWITPVKPGIRELFIIFASIEVGICALSIPMYVFGKCLRAYFAKRDILKMCGLR